MGIEIPGFDILNTHFLSNNYRAKVTTHKVMAKSTDGLIFVYIM